MATERRAKTFIYKKAVFLKHMDGDTLEALLKKAIKKASKPFKRRHNPSGDEATYCFINSAGERIRKEGGQLYGCEFLSYVKGADQSTLAVDEEAEEVPISSLAPQKGKEFLEGNLYFGVAANHLVVMQSNALRVKELEDHLNWLLVQHSSVIDAENRVELHDPTPGDGDARKIYSDARGVRIDAPVTWQRTTDKTTKAAKEESARVKPTGRAWEIMKAALGDLLPAHLTAADMDQKASLIVELYLRWKGKPGEDGEDFMAQIARQMRHVDDEFDYTVETKNGPVGKEEFKPKHSVSIPWKAGRPDFSDLFPRMLSWLFELQETGKIRA